MIFCQSDDDDFESESQKNNSMKFFVLMIAMARIVHGFVNHHVPHLSLCSPVRRKLSCSGREETNKQPDIKTYFLGNDGEFRSDMKKAGIDINRFISFNLLAIVLALGANFVGVTSNLMTNTSPEFFRSLKLDQLYQIDGYFRFVENEDGYEFQYPDNWMADQTVTLANARERELPKAIRERQIAKSGKIRPNAGIICMNN